MDRWDYQYVAARSRQHYSHILPPQIQLREPDRMVGGERTRAYRYGMTLLCVGAIFNWLGFSNNQSDPVRFIGYTCLASGALLLCMAVCFWANTVNRTNNNQIRPESTDFSGVNIIDPQTDRYTAEKPPDYNSVADLSPPPCYDDAIRLSPAYLPTQIAQCSSLGQIPMDSPPPPVVATASSPPVPQQSEPQDEATKTSQTTESISTLSRVIRLSSRLLKRTLSNVDGQSTATSEPQPPPAASPPNGTTSTTLQQSRSDQNVKNTLQNSDTHLV